MDGLWLKAEDLHKIGILLNNDGGYKGKKILSENWIQMMYQLPLNNIAKGIGCYGMTVKPLFISEKLKITNETRLKLIELGIKSHLLEKINKMEIDSSYSFSDFGKKLKNLFSDEELEELTAFSNKNLIPLYSVINENYIVMHGGEYGLLLAVFPKKNTVLVRYLGEKWGRKKKEDGSENKYLIDNELISSILKLHF